METQTKETQAQITPQIALNKLKEGNARFVNQNMVKRELLAQVEQTGKGQYPFAVILSCIDSRVSSELIFDQGIGDIFNARIAGNFVNEDILGSMEFACKLAGSKLVLVLGHTKCGAIKGACDDAKLGNLTALISKLRPAVEAVKEPAENRNSGNSEFVENVCKKNVEMTIANIKSQSSVLKEMDESGEIVICGAIYNVDNGKVEFL